MRFSFLLLRIWWTYTNAIEAVDGHLERRFGDDAAWSLTASFLSVTSTGFHFACIVFVHEDYLGPVYGIGLILYVILIGFPAFVLLEKAKMRSWNPSRLEGKQQLAQTGKR